MSNEELKIIHDKVEANISFQERFNRIFMNDFDTLFKAFENQKKVNNLLRERVLFCKKKITELEEKIKDLR